MEKNVFKERLFEICLMVVGLVGLLVLFSLLYLGPRFIFEQILKSLNIFGR